MAVAAVRTPFAGAAEDVASHLYTADGTATDAAGGAHASWTGTEAYGDGATEAAGDRSFALDGVSWLTAGGPDTGNFGTNDFTIAFSFRTSGPGPHALVSKRAGCTSGTTFLDIRAERNGPGVLAELQDAANANLQLAHPTPIGDGAFHAVSFQRVGAELRLDVDGVVVTTATAGVIDLDIADPLRFGSSGCSGLDGTHPMVGNLDGISVVPGLAVPPPTTTSTTSASTSTTTTGVPMPTTAPATTTTATTVGTTTSAAAPSTIAAAPTSTTVVSRPVVVPSTTTTTAIPRVDAPPTDVARAFGAALPSPTEVDFSIGAVTRSLWLVLLLLALLRLPITIVDRTLEVYGDDVGARLAGARERVGAVGRLIGRLPLPARIVTVGVVGSVLFAASQPGLGFDRASLVLVLGVLLALSIRTAVSAMV